MLILFLFSLSLYNPIINNGEGRTMLRRRMEENAKIKNVRKEREAGSMYWTRFPSWHYCIIQLIECGDSC